MIAALNVVFVVFLFKQASLALIVVTLLNYYFLQKQKVLIPVLLSIFLLLSLRIPADWSWKDIYLSVVLVFFCLQQISAAIDIDRESTLKPESLILWVSFSLFFPSLIAGPISRWADLSTQLRQPSKFCEQTGWDAITLFLKSIFKKMVFAAPLIVIFEKYFSASESIGIFLAIGLAIILRFALWADISAHTDWARATSSLLGINLPENFNNPFSSRTLADFWRRWHMTLSSWLQDYVFLPIVFGYLRNKLDSKYVVALGLLVTFSVFGLWHGVTLGLFLMGFFKGLGVLLQEGLYKKLPRLSGSIILQIIFITFFVMLPTLLLKMPIEQFYTKINFFDFDLNFLKFESDFRTNIRLFCFILCGFFWIAVEKCLFPNVKWKWSIAIIAFAFWLLLADFKSTLGFMYAGS